MPFRSRLSTFRDPLKGIAILWVCFFHARLGLEQLPVIGPLQQTGYLGVDLFILLSGMGLYHSLEKAPSPTGYLKRRAARLLPAFLPVCILWCILMIPALGLTGKAAIHTALGNLTMLGYLTGAPCMLNWYLTLLLVTILLAIPLHRVLSRARRPYIAWGLMILAAGLCGLIFIGRDQMMLVSRLPIFVLGMGLCAVKPSKERKGLTALLLWLGFLAGCGLLWLGFVRWPHWQIRYGLYWYPALLMIPGLCTGLCWLMDKLSGAGLRCRALDALGKASFEIFLFNGWFELYTKQVLRAGRPAVYLFWMMLSIALGLLWHWLVGMAANRFHKKDDR